MKKLISVFLAVCMLTAAFGLFSAVSAEGELKMTMESPYVKMQDPEEGIWEFTVKIENAADNLLGDAWIGIYPTGATQEAIESKEASLYTWWYVDDTNRFEGTANADQTLPNTIELTVSDDWVEDQSGIGVEPPTNGKTYDLILFYADHSGDDYNGYKIVQRLTFTFGEAPETDGGSESGSGSGEVNPPQTADFSVAVVAVAVLALGAAVVISKKH